MREGVLYEKLENKKTACNLCRHRCVLKTGQRGICGVRENREGTLYSLVYDRVAARSVDPIEKKPFFHFFPGSLAYSVATMGCNFKCRHCQNCHLSRTPAETGEIHGQDVPPEAIVKAALQQGCRSISYTYSEPTIYAELALDTARLAKEKGLYNTFVTNGYESPELIKRMTGLIDGANIDLKAFTEEFYKKISGAKLEGVLDSIRRMHGAGIWIEITTLLIPGLNDSPAEVETIAGFIAELDPHIPWHISRYHPAYQMLDRQTTPRERLSQARKIGLETGLKYVYTGNVPGDEGENTYCHSCGEKLIGRFGFTLNLMNLNNGKCPKCGAGAAGRY